jgi:hypothetical protein
MMVTYVVGYYAVLEIIYFMDFVQCLVLQSRRNRFFKMRFTIVRLFQNFMVNSYKPFRRNIVPQSSGPNILDCLIMKTEYVIPKRPQLFTKGQGVTLQKAWIFKIIEAVTISAMKNAVFCDVTPCRVALRSVGNPSALNTNDGGSMI